MNFHRLAVNLHDEAKLVYYCAGSLDILAERYRSGLKLDRWSFRNMIGSWKGWERTYIPPNGLDGKTVLDLGASCGETAYFFLQKGAKKVIAVENDLRRCILLKENASNWSIEVVPRKFEISDLDREYDFMKVNIEGYELLLCEYGKPLKPAAVQAHNWYILERLSALGFHPANKPDEMTGHCCMHNF